MCLVREIRWRESVHSSAEVPENNEFSAKVRRECGVPFPADKCYSLGTLLGFICQLRALQPKATLTKVADLASSDAFSAFPAETMWDIRVRKKSLSLSFPSS